MNDIEIRPRTPGIVIFVAILNFFSSVMFFLISAFTALAMVFGAAWGVDQYVTQRMAQYAPDPNFSYGLSLIFGVSTAFCLVFALFFLVIGLGLLRGKKYAWFLQIAMSILGLLGLPLSMVMNIFLLPFGAILNIVILIFFFRSRVRDYFKV